MYPYVFFLRLTGSVFISLPLPLREGGGGGNSPTEGQVASMPRLTRASPQPLHEVTARSIPRLVTAPHRFSDIGAIHLSQW